MKQNYRPDIDGLRAIAVADALCCHHRIPHLAGGFAGVGWLRLVVTCEGETDMMALKAKSANPHPKLREAVNAILHAVTKLGGNVELVPIGAFSNDGKVIADEH